MEATTFETELRFLISTLVRQSSPIGCTEMFTSQRSSPFSMSALEAPM